MKHNIEALAHLRAFEGISITPYRCPAGKWSQGYGRTRGVTEHSKPITRSTAEQWLLDDYQAACEAVDRHVTVPLNENQRGGLACLVFNIGEGNFARSTLLKRLNDQRYEEAADQFLRWVYAGNKQLPGLLRRRAAEKALFLKTPPREAPHGMDSETL